MQKESIKFYINYFAYSHFSFITNSAIECLQFSPIIKKINHL